MAEEMTENFPLVMAMLKDVGKDISDLKADFRTGSEGMAKMVNAITEMKVRQESWATKREVAEMAAQWQLALQPIAASSSRAHERIDSLTSSLAVLADTLNKVDGKVDQIGTDLATRTAQFSGASSVLRPTLAWVAAVAAAVAAAFAGHFVG